MPPQSELSALKARASASMSAAALISLAAIQFLVIVLLAWGYRREIKRGDQWRDWCNDLRLQIDRIATTAKGESNESACMRRP